MTRSAEPPPNSRYRHVSANIETKPGCTGPSSFRRIDKPCLLKPSATRYLSVTCVSSVHADLQLFEEIARISSTFSTSRAPIKLTTLLVDSYEALREELRTNLTIDILHIMGHGQCNGVRFPNGRVLSLTDLRKLLAYRKAKGVAISALFINACFSASLARDLTSEVPFIVAAHGTISDTAAIAISAAFYRALSGSHGCFDIAAAYNAAAFLGEDMTRQGDRCQLELFSDDNEASVP